MPKPEVMKLAGQRDSCEQAAKKSLYLGSIALGVGLTLDVVLGGDLARSGHTHVASLFVEGIGGLVGSGVGILAFVDANITSRRADTIHAEILRREADS